MIAVTNSQPSANSAGIVTAIVSGAFTQRSFPSTRAPIAPCGCRPKTAGSMPMTSSPAAPSTAARSIVDMIGPVPDRSDRRRSASGESCGSSSCSSICCNSAARRVRASGVDHQRASSEPAGMIHCVEGRSASLEKCQTFALPCESAWGFPARMSEETSCARFHVRSPHWIARSTDVRSHE